MRESSGKRSSRPRSCQKTVLLRPKSLKGQHRQRPKPQEFQCSLHRSQIHRWAFPLQEVLEDMLEPRNLRLCLFLRSFTRWATRATDRTSASSRGSLTAARVSSPSSPIQPNPNFKLDFRRTPLLASHRLSPSIKCYPTVQGSTEANWLAKTAASWQSQSKEWPRPVSKNSA